MASVPPCDAPSCRSSAQYAGYIAWRGMIEETQMRYDEAVRKFGSRVVARGRWLGAHLEAQVTKPREQRTPHELNHMPFDTLFREVGAALCDIPELAELT